MNINELMKQAQAMQRKMQEMQKEMAIKIFEGKAGGGLVSISMSGDGVMRKVAIDPSLMKEEEKEMLEDLLIAAHNEARDKAHEESNNSMSGFGKLPGGMGF